MKRARLVPKDYPAGYFTALIAEHNWPPNFEPRMDIDPNEYARRLGGLQARETALQKGVGWNTGTIVLPNTPKWLRPQMMKAPAR